MSRNITLELLEEDSQLYKEMMVALQNNDHKKYKELHRKYYIENDDIRIYWQTS